VALATRAQFCEVATQTDEVASTRCESCVIPMPDLKEDAEVSCKTVADGGTAEASGTETIHEAAEVDRIDSLRARRAQAVRVTPKDRTWADIADSSDEDQPLGHPSLVVALPLDVVTAEDLTQVAVGAASDELTHVAAGAASDDLTQVTVGAASEDLTQVAVGAASDDQAQMAVGAASEDLTQEALGAAEHLLDEDAQSGFVLAEGTAADTSTEPTESTCTHEDAAVVSEAAWEEDWVTVQRKGRSRHSRGPEGRASF